MGRWGWGTSRWRTHETGGLARVARYMDEKTRTHQKVCFSYLVGLLPRLFGFSLEKKKENGIRGFHPNDETLNGSRLEIKESGLN